VDIFLLRIPVTILVYLLRWLRPSKPPQLSSDLLIHWSGVLSLSIKLKIAIIVLLSQMECHYIIQKTTQLAAVMKMMGRHLLRARVDG
jgi:hypothetical protein